TSTRRSSSESWESTSRSEGETPRNRPMRAPWRKPLSLPVALPMLLALPCACGHDAAERAPAHWKRGRELRKKKEYAAAIEQVSRAFLVEGGLEPRERVKAGLALSEVLLAEARYREGLQALERLEKLDPLLSDAQKRDPDLSRARAKATFLEGRA